jgi:hypothetical protein
LAPTTAQEVVEIRQTQRKVRVMGGRFSHDWMALARAGRARVAFVSLIAGAIIGMSLASTSSLAASVTRGPSASAKERLALARHRARGASILGPSLRPLFAAGGTRGSLPAGLAAPLPSARAARATRVHPDFLGGSGEIAGTVTSEADNTAIKGIEVCTFTLSEEEEFLCTTTNASGEYTLTGLEAGEYYVEFSVPEGSNLNYVTQYYQDTEELAEAERVSVSEHATHSGVDASLSTGAEITGKVTSAVTTKPIEGIEVCATDEEQEIAGCALTDATGKYAIPGLESGGYVVEFFVSYGGQQNYVTQYYPATPRRKEAESVQVTADALTPGISAALLEGGQIKGTVTSVESKAPLEHIVACAYSEELFFEEFFRERCTETGPDGTYDIASLGTGDYYVYFYSSGEYGFQLYDDTTTYEQATKVPVEAGHEKTGINAALGLVPVATKPPAIEGSAVEGQTLKVIHGTWSPAATSYYDEWYVCTANEESCSEEGVVGETFTLGASTVGHIVGVYETAITAVGVEGYAFSGFTSAVTSAPKSSSSPSPSPPAPAPAVAVLASTTSVASAAELKQLLLGLLAPSGKNAKIAAVLKHGGYALLFSALTPGQLTISWYLVPKGAHVAKAKPTLVARGQVALSAAGGSKLVIKLTSRGRALLKHAHKIKLTALGSMAGTGGVQVSASKAFVLKR